MQNEYGAAIKAARKAKGLTLAELASELAVSVPYLHDVEAGRRGRLTVGREAVVSAALDIPITRLSVLGSMASGTVSVEGLSEEAVTKVVATIARLRK